MIIDCISDLHGFYPELEGGDLLIVCGDLTRNNEVSEYLWFARWLHLQDYKKKILVAGNHDARLVEQIRWPPELLGGMCAYLMDSGTEFAGLKIWGSPWTRWFNGVNPHCAAFMLPEEGLEEKWALIPDDVDILVTHGPPLNVLDGAIDGSSCGSSSLWWRVADLKSLKFHIFGHVHEQGGKLCHPSEESGSATSINCSYVDENYEPVNKPMRLIYEHEHPAINRHDDTRF